MFKGIHHVAIICSDYEKSKKFYVETLGLKVLNEQYRKDRSSYKLDLKVGDSDQIELFSFLGSPKRVTNPEAQGLRHIAFEAEDFDAIIKNLKKLQVEVEPTRNDSVTGKRLTFIHDPDGLPIEIQEA